MGRVCEETGRKFEFKLRAIFYLFIYGRASEVHACRPARLRLYVIVAEVGRVLDTDTLTACWSAHAMVRAGRAHSGAYFRFFYISCMEI